MCLVYQVKTSCFFSTHHPKDDPAYPYAKWGYLLAMYKSGHGEYKEQMEKFINSTTDETMKFQFQGSYEMAIESNN